MSFVLYLSIPSHFPITDSLFSIAEYIAFSVVGHFTVKFSFLNTSNFKKNLDRKVIIAGTCPFLHDFSCYSRFLVGPRFG